MTLSTAMPTLGAMRRADFTAPSALDDVTRWLRRRMDATRVDPAMPALRAWPAASQESPHEPATSEGHGMHPKAGTSA